MTEISGPQTGVNACRLRLELGFGLASSAIQSVLLYSGMAELQWKRPNVMAETTNCVNDRQPTAHGCQQHFASQDAIWLCLSRAHSVCEGLCCTTAYTVNLSSNAA